MASPTAPPASPRESHDPPLPANTARERALVVALSLVASAAAVALGHGLGDLPRLGIYFDGHFYIDIARSFPLPYGEGARDYASHAPGYGGVLWLARTITFGALDWGTLAVVVTWLAAAGACVAFYELARELDVPALQATALFALANPAWLLVASAPHAEPVALACLLACFVAHRRGALGTAVGWLSLATLARYPAILVGAALAWDLLVRQRRFDARTLGWLALPVALFAAFNAYLAWRIPGFTHLFEVHRVHWDAGFALPFQALAEYAAQGERTTPQFALIFATALFYAAMTIAGFRTSQRDVAWLAVWAGIVLLFHVSLSGRQGAVSFTRLAILAWPAALLIAWRLRPRALQLGAAAALCLLLGALGLFVVQRQIAVAVYFQSQRSWMQDRYQRLGEDEPLWLDFERVGRESAPPPRGRRPEF